MRANQDLKNTRDFGEHAAEGGNICGIDEYTKEGGNKRDFGEHATEGGNKRNFGEHAIISGNKRDLYTPLWEYGTRLFVYATKRQRKGWQPARAALAGNATLMRDFGKQFQNMQQKVGRDFPCTQQNVSVRAGNQHVRRWLVTQH